MLKYSFILIPIFIFTFLVSCDNKTAVKNKVPNQLDSLLNFDTIIAIYSHTDPSSIIKDDGLEGFVETEPPPYLDSLNKWTNSEPLLDSIKKIFPKLKIIPNGGIETGCCSYHWLFIVTKHKQYTIIWPTHTGNGTTRLNEERIIYETNFDTLEIIYNLLDRKIIRKEIEKKDTVLYNLTDVYNKRFIRKPQEAEKTIDVYIFK